MQLLTVVQQWLTNVPESPTLPGAAETDDAETVADAKFDGFKEGLKRADVPVEIGLTAEEYVRRGLERHGGRLRQQEIVQRTGWSEATVSRTLSAMEDAEQVTRIQVGRENVVCLPHAIPGCASPARKGGQAD